MEGIKMSYLNLCINIILKVYKSLMNMSVTELRLKGAYGKPDTLFLDANPEILIKERIGRFNPFAVFVTEETDNTNKQIWPRDKNPASQPVMFFSDPMDRSKYLAKFIDGKEDKTLLKDILGKKGIVQCWEKIAGKPAIVTGSTCSITCVDKGSADFSVILNIVTGHLFVSCAGGNIFFKLPGPDKDEEFCKINIDYLLKKGQPVIFPSSADSHSSLEKQKRFVTYLGKAGYEENFRDSMIFLDDAAQHLHYQEPGGPSRILYLSNFLKPSLGFILANGEKIGEWIHWLPFLRFSKNEQGDRALKIFEIAIARPWTKNGILMSTSPPYSLFSMGDGEAFLDMSRLRDLDTPSHYRSMILITPYDNDAIIQIMVRTGYREVGETLGT